MTNLHTTCPYCGVGCGVEIPEAGNREIRVHGLQSHPANQGRLCVKGTHLGDVLPLRQRLLRPRVAGATVAWDAALDLIAERLRTARDETGPNSLGFYLSGQLLTEDYYVANKLAKGYLGTANVDTNSRLCMSSAVAAYTRAFGEDAVPGCYEDLEEADLLVLIGSNLAWAHPVLFQRIQAAKLRNPAKKLVVIDPRATDTSAAADLHLALKPGTDGRLLNALLCWLADRQAVDADYIRNHTLGFEATLEKARNHAGTDLDELATACGLGREDIQRFFTWFQAHAKTVTAWSMGINQSRSGVDKSQAIINLHLATGRIGKPGATPFSITGQPNAMGGREVGGLANQLASHMDFAPRFVDRVRRFWQAPHMAPQAGLKAVDLFKAAARGEIKVLWIMATNPLATMPNAPLIEKALRRVDTVIVSDVIRDNDTLQYADIVLPAAAWGEKDGTVTNSERRISRQRGFLIPPGQAKPDWWALAEVGKRLGYGAAFDYEHPAAIFAEHARLSAFEAEPHRQFNLTGLEELDVSGYNAMQPVQWPLNADAKGKARVFTDGDFATPDGRACFIPVAPAEPDFAADRLTLNTGRFRDQWHTMSRTGYAPRLTQHRRDFKVSLNPEDAHSRSIADNDLVRIANDQGHFLARAELSGSIGPGQLFAPMHWNRQFAGAGGVARVIPSVVDPVSGQPESKHALVDIESVEVSVYGLFIGAELPEALAKDATWFMTPLESLNLWQLFYTGPSLTEIRRRLEPEKGDLILSDDEDHWFQTTSQPPSEATHWLTLSTAPPAEPDAHWLEQQFRVGNDSMDDWARGQPPGENQRGQVVCTCFNVRDTAIQGFLEDNPKASLETVQQALKCSTSCGSCLTEVLRLIRTGPPEDVSA